MVGKGFPLAEATDFIVFIITDFTRISCADYSAQVSGMATKN